MTAHINDLRDQVAVRIADLVLPIEVDISTRTMPRIDVERVAAKTLLTVTPAAQQFEVDNRNGGNAAPAICIGVHRKLATNDDGEPDQTLCDQLVELCEVLAESLIGNYEGAAAQKADVPVLFNQQMLEEKGLFQSAVLLTFSYDYWFSE